MDLRRSSLGNVYELQPSFPQTKHLLFCDEHGELEWDGVYVERPCD